MFGGQNIDLVISGTRDFKTLSGGDKLRFDHLMSAYFNAIESTIFSRNAFLLGDETLENWGHLLRTRMLPYAGVRDWWSEAKAIFAPETRAWVDEQIDLPTPLRCVDPETANAPGLLSKLLSKAGSWGSRQSVSGMNERPSSRGT